MYTKLYTKVLSFISVFIAYNQDGLAKSFGLHPERGALVASLILRGSTYYIQFMEGGTARRESTHTDSLQVAKEKLRQHESGQARGAAVLPTRTPVSRVLGAYIQHIRTAHTPKSVQTSIYYLRDAFGPVCDELKMTSRKPSVTTRKRPHKPGQDRRRKAPVISAPHFEAITKGQISSFIDGRMASRGIAPKTANRIRDTLSALFSWTMNEYDILMPGGLNPVSKVKKRKVEQQDIEFLSLEEVDLQLKALKDNVKMQAMVATMIYAGLRREELLWLRPKDLHWNEGPNGLNLLYKREREQRDDLQKLPATSRQGEVGRTGPKAAFYQEACSMSLHRCRSG